MDEFAPLSREPDFLPREELKEVRHYYALLMALGDQSMRQQELAIRSGIPLRSLPYYLAMLERLGYVSRKRPLAPSGVPTRRVRFALSDSLLRFWFRFIYPNVDRIAQSGVSLAFEQFIRPGLDAHWGLCFEHLCREALPAIHLSEGIADAAEIGEYWDGKTQVDVVGLRGDNRIDLCECKWGVCSKGVEKELQAKIAGYPNPGGLTIEGRIFCRKKPARIADTLFRWYDIEEIYRCLK